MARLYIIKTMTTSMICVITTWQFYYEKTTTAHKMVLLVGILEIKKNSNQNTVLGLAERIQFIKLKHRVLGRTQK